MKKNNFTQINQSCPNYVRRRTKRKQQWSVQDSH